MQKQRLQLHTAQLTQMGPASAMASKAEQTTQSAREFKGPVATHPARSDPYAGSQSLTEENLLPLTPKQLAAFQDVFKLFSCSPTGTVDMHSMKIALCNVGIQLGPQEMCEALRLADLDGDGIVSFKDFLGVLTDNHHLAQCMGQMRSSRVSDPQGLQTLFLEVLFKLLSQGFVPSKSGQEVTSYYYKKQRALRLSPSWRGQARGQGRPARAHAGLNYFCQAARLGGLSSSQLARSLHRLCKARAPPAGRGRGPEVRGRGPRQGGLSWSHSASNPTFGSRGPTPGTVPSSSSSRTSSPGARRPYSHIPNLEGPTRPESRTRSRASGPDVRFPKPHQPGRPKLPSNLRQLCKVDQPLEQMRLWKLPPSPSTLVQKQPSSPSPAYLQRCAVKSSYK